MLDLVTEGDALLEIEAGELGPITYLWRLDPCRMLVERLSDGTRRDTHRRIGASEAHMKQQWALMLEPTRHCQTALFSSVAGPHVCEHTT